MKNSVVLLHSILCMLFFFLFNSSFGQLLSDLEVTTSTSSQSTNWVPGNPLPLCAGQMILTISLDNTTTFPLDGTFRVNSPVNGNNSPVINPTSILINSCTEDYVVITVLQGNDGTGTFLEFELNELPPGECNVEVEFVIDCDNIGGSDGQNFIIEYVPVGTLNLSADDFNLSVLRPTLLLVNFRDHNDQPLLSEISKQHMIIQNNGHRTFNIKCTGGIVESFVLETEL